MWKQIRVWLLGGIGSLLFLGGSLALYFVTLDRLEVGDPEGNNLTTFLSLFAFTGLGAFMARPALLKLIAFIKSQTK
ncbi:hypothetical protein [Asticcacaulis sp.]|uniref:hypothetical protein n=1 Tax=Asticcacaulis sp. TaxID=1872648 RepID=UPI0026270F1D|nr:hypothetical protein [Asticcacaulis sp.]